MEITNLLFGLAEGKRDEEPDTRYLFLSRYLRVESLYRHLRVDVQGIKAAAADCLAANLLLLGATASLRGEEVHLVFQSAQSHDNSGRKRFISDDDATKIKQYIREGGFSDLVNLIAADRHSGKADVLVPTDKLKALGRAALLDFFDKNRALLSSGKFWRRYPELRPMKKSGQVFLKNIKLKKGARRRKDMEYHAHKAKPEIISTEPPKEYSCYGRNLKAINKALENVRVELDVATALRLSGMQLTGEELALVDGVTIRLDSSHFLYRRQFSGNWVSHGRFYSSFQCLPARWRRALLINGKPALEVDFSCCQPRMLYHREGIEPPQEDIYGMMQLEGVSRDIVKVLFNLVLNCQSPEAALQGIQGRIDSGEMSLEPHITASELLHKFYEAYSDVSSEFGEEAWLWLQKYDSDVIEAVMLACAERKIPFLTVHDSVLTTADEVEIKSIMSECYKDILKTRFEPRFKVEHSRIPSKAHPLTLLKSGEVYWLQEIDFIVLCG